MLLKDGRLRAFYAVAYHKSFTVAAKHLLLSQQAVSFQIKNLEDELGTRLFKREQAGIELTDAGHRLFSYAERILKLYSEAEAELQTITGAMKGRLSIAATPSLVTHVLPTAIGRFRKSFPEVKMDIDVGNSSECIEHLSKNSVDVAFVSEGLSLDGFAFEELLHDEVTFIASSDDPVTERGRISAAELCSLPFVARNEGSATRAMIEKALEKIDISFDQLNVVLVLGSAEAVKAAVEAGAGIGAVSRLSLRREIKAGALSTIKIDRIDLFRCFFVVRRISDARRPLIDRFVSFAKSAIG